ncbi:hypothetical protein [Desertivirga arenae]|uniref:hypothetical protein n=1 Tax=Desertivirga arenae TaxID=2810309 RepID=UPI001A96E33D|nr:hypothetical protein [Pedobacter sp. SYSU D00823]
MNPYPFNFITKPAGPACNLHCDYCYYLEKEQLFPTPNTFMNELTLENFTREYIQEQPGNEVTFVWQGGEPCLAGLEFYKKALEFQKKFAKGKTVIIHFRRMEPCLTTNGVLSSAKTTSW